MPMNLLRKEQLAPMNHIYRFYERNDYFRSAAENGYKSVDYWTCGSHYLLDSYSYEDTKPIKSKLKEYGLNVICMTPEQTCPKPYNMASKSSELKKRTKQYFKNAILAAHELECSKVLITSGWQYYSEDREEAWKRSVDMVGNLCNYAKKYGVFLTMETLSPQSTTLANTISDLKRIMTEVNSEQYTITIDLDTITNSGETVQEYFDIFGSKVNHCHFMDHKEGIFGHIAFGDGDINPEEILYEFYKNNFQGHFTLEYTMSRYFKNPHKIYKKTMEILKPYIK